MWKTFSTSGHASSWVNMAGAPECYGVEAGLQTTEGLWVDMCWASYPLTTMQVALLINPTFHSPILLIVVPNP